MEMEHVFKNIQNTNTNNLFSGEIIFEQEDRSKKSEFGDEVI